MEPVLRIQGALPAGLSVASRNVRCQNHHNDFIFSSTEGRASCEICIY
jgi:hypothetical protein